MSFAPLQRPKPTDQELDRGRGGATQARRYWPGKAPDWVPPNTAEEASDDEEQAVERTSVAAPVIIRAKDDPRLARLADKSDTGDRGARRREVAAPRVVSRRQREESSDEASSDEDSDKQSEDEDAVEARRAAVREKTQVVHLLTAWQMTSLPAIVWNIRAPNFTGYVHTLQVAS
ncbi:hypothetical protein WJX79_007829 [Trebouxia sp. C0005]